MEEPTPAHKMEESVNGTPAPASTETPAEPSKADVEMTSDAPGAFPVTPLEQPSITIESQKSVEVVNQDPLAEVKTNGEHQHYPEPAKIEEQPDLKVQNGLAESPTPPPAYSWSPARSQQEKTPGEHVDYSERATKKAKFESNDSLDGSTLNGGTSSSITREASPLPPLSPPVRSPSLENAFHSASPTNDSNGVFTFQGYVALSSQMTEEEQLQEGADAAEQAQDGDIDIDSASVTDGGYETDNASAASTSLASSIRDYSFENGRRYHKFREGRYNFPNDDVEQEREDMKHAMVKMLCQQLHFAPIGENPQEILDIGTGTGIWAIEMGDLFPSATVLGIDLSPIQPDWVPPNVRFMIDDVESPWLHPRNHFDYIHSRNTVMAIKDWPRLFRRAHEHLKPGGWIELQEIWHYPIASSGQLSPDHPVAQYWRYIDEGLATLGVDFSFSSGGRIANMMRECGYVNVTERVFHVPLGTWPKNRVLKTVGLYWRTILLDGIQAIALGPMTRGLKWTREQVELFLVSVRKAYHDNSAIMYMPLVCVYGQKPPTE